MPTESIPDALVGERLDRVVALITGLSRSSATALIEQGDVEVNAIVETSRRRRLELGDVVETPDVAPAPVDVLVADPTIEFDVVFADEHIIVVNKPAGLVVHPGNGPVIPTLVHGLLARFPDIAAVGQPDRPGIVHRLDKGTSGLLVVARSEQAYETLVAALAARTVSRIYRALVWGHMNDERGLIDAPIGRSGRDRTRMVVSADGREARTHFHRLRTFVEPDLITEVECRLETGRTHQIRVHLEAIGHPVVGDQKYHGFRDILPMQRPFLHALELSIVHPVTGEELDFHAPLPPDLEAVLAELESVGS